MIARAAGDLEVPFMDRTYGTPIRFAYLRRVETRR
jgi:hypothetical protein